jgi:hypothetical protein
MSKIENGEDTYWIWVVPHFPKSENKPYKPHKNRNSLQSPTEAALMTIAFPFQTIDDVIANPSVPFITRRLLIP